MPGLPRVVLLLGATAAAVVVIAGMRYSAWLLAPVFLALVVVAAASPIPHWLRRKGMPEWLGTTVLIVLVYTTIAALVLVLAVSVACRLTRPTRRSPAGSTGRCIVTRRVTPDDGSAGSAGSATPSAPPAAELPHDGQPAGIASRLTASAIDAAVLLALLGAGYLAFAGLTFMVSPVRFHFPLPRGSPASSACWWCSFAT
jgi:hypothetical protein